MWHEALELTVAAAVAVAHAYWPAAVVLYSLRFCFPFYHAITAYGKLRASSGYLLLRTTGAVSRHSFSLGHRSLCLGSSFARVIVAWCTIALPSRASTSSAGS